MFGGVWRWVRGLSFLAVGLLAAPEPARACSIQAVLELRGAPQDGEVEVPTDVVLFYNQFSAGVDSGMPPAFSLSSEAGEAVALQYRPLDPSNFELTPETALLPHTRYTLRVGAPAGASPSSDLSLSFVTGAGPVVEPPEAPAARAVNYVRDPPSNSSCDQPPTGTCVAMDDSLVWELTPLDSFGQLHDPYLIRGSIFWSFDTGFSCLELRRRAANGTYSEPQTLCGADGETQMVGGEGYLRCTSDGVTIGPWLVDDDSGAGGEGGSGATEPHQDRLVKGCSCSVPGSTSREPLLALSGLVLAVAMGRRRAGRGAR